jgi:probable F420-dependent oxidoreductase
MQLGVVFPQVDIGTDPAVIRAFARAIEGAGFHHLLAFDHVLGADASRFDGPIGGFPSVPFTAEHPLHEVFTLFAYLAAITEDLQFFTSMLVLPQRQTALVAKQAAELDILSGGRFRLAVGVGWNDAEYEGMGADFHTRGARLDEQIEVLRQLWSKPLVTFEGRWHHLDRLGINPLPFRPVPLWVGSGPGEKSLRRVARVAEGWMSLLMPTEDLATAIRDVRRYTAEAGRDPAELAVEARIAVHQGDAASWSRRAEELRALGVTHLTLFSGRGQGFSAARHIEKLLEGRQSVLAVAG